MTTEANPQTGTKKETSRFKQLSMSEYKALQEKEAKKFKFSLPGPVKFILSLPIILLCLFGIVYIPFMAFSGLTSNQPATDTAKKEIKK